MWRHVLCATFVLAVSGLTRADEFEAYITNVDGDKVTFEKENGKLGVRGKRDEPRTLPVAKDVTIAEEQYRGNKYVAGAKVAQGLMHEFFTAIGSTGQPVRITTSDDEKTIMQILVSNTLANNFIAFITRIDGDKVTFQRYRGAVVNAPRGMPTALPVAKDAVIARIKTLWGENKIEAGDKIVDGLKSKIFAKIGDQDYVVLARIITSDDTKTITQVLVSLVTANEFSAYITNVDADRVTFQRVKFGGGKGPQRSESTTLPVAKDATIAFGAGGAKGTVSAVENGLKNEIFTNISAKGRLAQFILSDDSETIRQILLFRKKTDPK
jgi:hypothetical protein